MTDDEVERLAKAIYEAAMIMRPALWTVSWESLPEIRKERWRKVARNQETARKMYDR